MGDADRSSNTRHRTHDLEHSTSNTRPARDSRLLDSTRLADATDADEEPLEPGPAPFGALLGFAPGNVPVYSSDYETADPRDLPDRSAFRSSLDGLYMGYKWQCVEFARRWMYVNTGCVFDDVAMAHEIFRLRNVREVKTKKTLPLYAFRNGSRRLPVRGSLLIWEPGG